MDAGFRFHDRTDAGRRLGWRLDAEGVEPGALVLALPRGGVPVGYEVAKILHADLDVLLVRKLGVPGDEELAMGAIASGGIEVINAALVNELRISPEEVKQSIAREREEIERREALYREGRAAAGIAHRTVILTDDGMATGATMLAAARAVRQKVPKRIVVAVPVASRSACRECRRVADQAICLMTPEPFDSVGTWYEDFVQTTDAEVQGFLRAVGEP